MVTNVLVSLFVKGAVGDMIIKVCSYIDKWKKGGADDGVARI